MASILFVHGTGVRQPAYDAALKQIKQSVASFDLDLVVERCLWGEPHGARLKQHGASIPDYHATRSVGSIPDEEVEIIRWDFLYKYPRYELRLLALMSDQPKGLIPGRQKPSEILAESIRALSTSEKIKHATAQVGLADVFHTASTNIIDSDEYRNALQSVSELSQDHRIIVARAIVATALLQAEQRGSFSTILLDANLRNQFIDLVFEELGGTDRSIPGSIAKKVGTLLAPIGTQFLANRRGFYTSEATPAIGDILVYQGQGTPIREFIRQRIKEIAPPIILLGHSLGGIACVDLLIQEVIPEVKLLLTVGSQAPLFYEIGALHSLEYGETLPDYFPAWLNIFDKKDFLSFIGNGLFETRVVDKEVDNRQPFPKSHSAYWFNADVWQYLKETWLEILKDI